MQVRIRSSYIDGGQDYRQAIGVVIGREESIYGLDYLVQFPCGTVEPYSEHEFDEVL